MTKTDEAFQEAVLALRDWIDFIATREKETTEQLERAKRRTEMEAEAGAVPIAPGADAHAGLGRIRQDLQDMGVIDPPFEDADESTQPTDSWM